MLRLAQQLEGGRSHLAGDPIDQQRFSLAPASAVLSGEDHLAPTFDGKTSEVERPANVAPLGRSVEGDEVVGCAFVGVHEVQGYIRFCASYLEPLQNTDGSLGPDWIFRDRDAGDDGNEAMVAGQPLPLLDVIGKLRGRVVQGTSSEDSVESRAEIDYHVGKVDEFEFRDHDRGGFDDDRHPSIS